MTVLEKLVDQHILEYESRVKHVYELIGKAREEAANLDDGHAAKSLLENYQEQHTEISDQVTKLKEMPLEHWREEMIQSAGPMGILDILAQKVEDLVENLEE